jgi:hypothetical protein
MRLAFVIRRDNHYRLLGPAIDRALARGWDVECWHSADEGLKGARTLEQRERGPSFRRGRPRRREFGAGGVGGLAREVSPDVAITMYPPPGLARGGGVRWLGLQYTLNLGELLDGAGVTPFDGLAIHTEHWRTLAADSVRIMKETRGRGAEPVDDGAVAATLRRCATVVGFPELDQLDAELIDPAAVRRRLGLEPSRPVVVYCPFPFVSNPRTYWTRHIYGGGRLRRRVAAWLPRGRRYAPDVANGWDDRGVVRSMRAFCDANGAALVVKARAKDPAAAYLRAVADRVLYDESDYPATILEVMSLASLCVHFFSTVAYEAAYAAVPSVCVTADPDDLGFSPTLRRAYLSTATGSSFNFPGVTYPLSVAEVVGGFGRRRLGDFPLEPVARAQYLDKFVGPDDGKASDRLLDVAASLVETSRSPR